MSCRDIWVKCHRELCRAQQPSQPVESLTEGKTAEELISLVSKSSHAGTEENVLSRANYQNITEDHQPQDNLLG